MLRKEKLKKWQKTLDSIFGEEKNYFKTTKLEEMAEILNEIFSKERVHIFLPDSGGLENFGKVFVEGKELRMLDNSNSDDALTILEPKELEYNGNGIDGNWSYIRIELKNGSPIMGCRLFSSEEYVELEDGSFIDRIYWDEQRYIKNGEEVKLPRTAKLIERFFSGSLVIFNSASSYNRDRNIVGDCYDARHNKMNADKFRNYINDWKEKYNSFNY